MSDHTNNTTQTNAHNSEPTGFFYRKDVIRWILRIFYLCCLALVLIDFFIHRHTETDIEKLPTFYAVYGFVACSILVFISKAMRVFLIRDEDYYDAAEDAEDFLNQQGLEHPTNEHTELQADSPNSSNLRDQETSS